MFRHTRLALSFVMPDPDRASRPLSSVGSAAKDICLENRRAPRRVPPSNSRGWLRFSKHIPFSAALLAIGRRPAKRLSLRFLPRQDSGEPFGPVTAGYRAKVAIFLPRQDSQGRPSPVAAGKRGLSVRTCSRQDQTARYNPVAAELLGHPSDSARQSLPKREKRSGAGGFSGQAHFFCAWNENPERSGALKRSTIVIEKRSDL